MDAFRRHTGTAVPLRDAQIDTDQVIPARFCVGVTRTGYGKVLFHDRRADPGFALDKPEYAGSSILIAGENFGCGSSREMAVWALMDAGFRAIIAPSFADIFWGNAVANGLPAIALSAKTVDVLFGLVEARPTAPITVDLDRREVTAGNLTVSFDIDENARWRLLNGLDDIELALRHLSAIEAHEARRRPTLPTTSRTI